MEKEKEKTQSRWHRLGDWLLDYQLLIFGIVLGAAIAVPLTVGLMLKREPAPAASTSPVLSATESVQTEPQETTIPNPLPNPLGVEDFAYDGDYLTCISAPCQMGIDVSTYQRNVDWQQVKDAGVEFVMIRAAYRGYSGGNVLVDEMLQSHYRGAKSVGLKVGFYFFSQAVSPAEARAEAEFLLAVIDGFEVDMPLVFDWEYISNSARTAGMNRRNLTNCARAFCTRIQEAGYEPMIYLNFKQVRMDVYFEELTEYKFWLAMYDDEMTFEYKIDMWQYTPTGKIPGINGDVDINLYFPSE